MTPELIGILAVGATLIGIGATMIGLLLTFRRDARADMATFRTEMRSDMATFRAEMRADMASFKTEMRAEMASFQTEMRANMEDFRAEVQAEFAQIRGELADLRQNLQALTERVSRLEGVVQGLFAPRGEPHPPRRRRVAPCIRPRPRLTPRNYRPYSASPAFPGPCYR